MLSWLGIPFATTATDVDESPRPGEDPAALAARLARVKARAAQNRAYGTWTLTADTVVEIEGESLGKPATAEEAREMLQRLRQRAHCVHTGVALCLPNRVEIVRRVTTDVWMRAYAPAEVERYIASGDPFDKAGAYAIQHPGFHPVSRVDRCYANVVGLPLCAVVACLRQQQIYLELDVRAICLHHLNYRCPAIDEGQALEITALDQGQPWLF
jgi:MAF protein